MKVKHGKTIEKFEPIKLEITIENEEELALLWAVFNVPRGQKNEAAVAYPKMYRLVNSLHDDRYLKITHAIFNPLDNYAIERNIKR